MGNIDIENTMLINIIYHNKKKENDYNDYLDIITKDLITGEKFLTTIENPQIDIYFTKEEYRNYDYNKIFIELDKTERHRVNYQSITNYIAAMAGPNYQKYIKNSIETKNYARINNIHKYKYVFGSDINIENFYRIQWVLNYDNDKPKPVTKMFLDIEVDIIDIDGFPKDGEAPINAVTLVDEFTRQVFTFLLDNPNNPQIQEFKDDIEEFIEELHNDFEEFYGKLKYNIFMYNDESQMLIDVFKLINTLKRDFLMIWNGTRFDIPYLIARIIELGLDPREIMCHKDFKIKDVFLKKDNHNFQIANQGDYFKISSYTVYLDQMRIYASLRKSGKQLRSNTLNHIAELEIADKKLDFSEEANIKTLPYVNYKKFVKYNIKDVLLQFGIELKTHDIDNVYQRAYTNVTTYSKVFKQTNFLFNRAYLEYYKQGLIIGNNINVHYGVSQQFEKKNDDDNEKFAGALVGDPELNSYTGINMLGTPSKYIFDNVIDMDMSSFYPSMIMAFNISPNCIVGKLILNTTIEDLYNTKDIDEGKYDAGKDFVDNLLVNNPANMGSKWFNLPKIDELDRLIKEKFLITNKSKLIIPEDFGKKYYSEKLIVDIKEINNE